MGRKHGKDATGKKVSSCGHMCLRNVVPINYDKRDTGLGRFGDLHVREIFLPVRTTAMTDQLVLDVIATAADSETSRSKCAISGLAFRKRDLVPLDNVRPSLADHIRKDHPGLGGDALISAAQLAKYRMKYVEELLESEHGEFTELERQVAASIANHDTIAENVEDDFEEERTFGQRLSDHLASFGGSWAFLMSFGVVLCLWMAVNLALGERRAFDAYPFILLNLVLSCIAAVQAPIIMMSQKRQEAKDRLRALNDYRVNLKAELEIRHLHEKMDHLISRQWQRLAEIQQMQIETMHELTRAVTAKKSNPI